MENQNPASLFFKSALVPNGWAGDVRLTHLNGRIVTVEPNATPSAGEEIHKIALPGMPNLHSHSFQRAMAGLAEHRVNASESSIFASRENQIDCVWVMGRKCVSGSRHPLAEASQTRFQAAIAKLL